MTKHNARLVASCDIGNINFLNKTCVLSVSVSNPAYSGSKLVATLRLINKTFKECTLVIGDTISRHTLVIKRDDLSKKAAYYEAKSYGTSWLERNLKTIEEELKDTPYKIKRWDDYLVNDRFDYYQEKVNQLFKEDLDYQSLCNKTVMGYLAQKSVFSDHQDFKIAYEVSQKYVLEECAIMTMQCEVENFNFDVYPNTRYKIISKTMQCLMPKELYITPLGIRYTRNNNLSKQSTNLDHILNQMLEHLPVHVYWKDKNGIIKGCSKRQAEFYGLTSEEFIGKSDSDFVSKEVSDEIHKNDLLVMQQKKSFSFEEENLYNNHKNYFLSKKIPLYTNEDISGILGISVDVTDQVMQKQELEKALQAKNMFLDSVSHEIKTPLHVLTTILENLYDEWDNIEETEKKNYLLTAIENNSRLHSLIIDMLDISRLQNHKMSFNFNKIDLIQIINAVAKEFKYIARERKIQVIYDHSQEFIVACDKNRISQVVRNLIDNAFKYGDSSQDIKIEVVNSEEKIKFIIDSNSFIAEEEFEEIFQVFSQGENGRASAKGTGLGLAIARELILCHSGNIWVEKNKDKSSVVFVFEIPTLENNICLDQSK